MHTFNPLDLLKEKIAEYGWAIQGVLSNPPFAYTVGLHADGLPELIVSGLTPEVAQIALTSVRDLLLAEREGGPAAIGRVDIGFNMDLFLIEADPEELKEYATAALTLSQNKAKFLQLCFPCPNGRFAWEKGFEGDPRLYKLFGEAPVIN